MVSTRRHWLHWLAALGIVLVMAFGIVGVASALERDDDGTVAADEVIDDDLMISYDTVTIDGTVNGNTFASGQSVTVNGTIDGNLLANGGTVTLNGVVHGSMAAAAQRIVINGAIEGTLYAAGASVILGPEGSVGRNVIFTGFGIEVEDGARVERDLLATGYQVLVGGEIEGDLEIEASALEISGSVGGDVTAEVESPTDDAFPFVLPNFPESVPSGLRVSEGAAIGGRLVYRSTVRQDDAIDAAPGGGVTFELSEDAAAAHPRRDLGARVGHWIVARIRELITLLVLGGLAVWKLPALLRQLADKMASRPLPAAGWGILVLVGGYTGAAATAVFLFILGILLAVVTLGGLANVAFGVGFSGLGLALAIFLLVVSYGTKLVVAYWGGRWILKGAAPDYVDHRVWPMAIGIVVYIVLRGIPLLGWLFGFVVTLLGLGAMWLTFREWRQASAGPAEAAPALAE